MLVLIILFLLLFPVSATASAPLWFEAHQGQASHDAAFVSRGERYALAVTPRGVGITLHAHDGVAATLAMRFVGGREDATVSGVDPLAGRSHYFIGKDPARWQTGVPHFGRVRWNGVYSGIDAVFYGNDRELEYDLVVAPGTDPMTIVLAFAGADTVELDATGALVLHAAGGDLTQRRPVVYQELDGGRRAIDGAFVRLGRHGGEERVGLRIGAYDRSRPLIIDPVLSYATYLGGSPDNDGRAIAADANGNAYVTGYTSSATFPTMGGLPMPNDDLQAGRDVFVTKYDASGAMVYSTYLGGTGDGTGEQGNAIAVDGSGNVYVTGVTDSSDFPTVNPLPAPNNALQGFSDGFVTKLGPDGDTIVYSTYFGGEASFDAPHAIAVDASTNAYIAGSTQSDVAGHFPVAGTFMNNDQHGITDAFVAKLATNGSSLVYSIYLGGTGVDDALGIAVRSGEAYVTGETRSSNFPRVSALGAPNDALRGFTDAFVAKVNTTGSALAYSTYLSGSSDIDIGHAIAVDGDGNAYVGGKTESNNFTTAMAGTGSLPAPNNVFRGGADGFVTKLGTAGNTIVFSTFLGGSSNGDDEEVNGIAVDGDHDVYVTGQTESVNFPVVNGLPLQTRNGAHDDAAFVTKIAAAGTSLVYSTYLGGTSTEVGRGIALDSMEHAFVVGQTHSDDFPVVNAEQATRSTALAGGDAFVARIDSGAPTPAAYVSGHVFVTAIEYGEVREFTPTGTLVRALPIPSGSSPLGTQAAGLAFDSMGNLYVADTTQDAIYKFSSTGVFSGAFATGITDGPQALVFDNVDNLYVSTTSGASDVHKYSSGGTHLTQFDVFIHRATDQWLDLAADQKTLFYTSNAEDVATFDVIANMGSPNDFYTGVLRDYGLRLLPGTNALVAEQEKVVRVNASGNVTKTYIPSTDGLVFQVSRDPDGVTFWAATHGPGAGTPGMLFNVNIASGNVVHQFAGASGFGAGIGGLAVFGELLEARGSGGPTPTPTGPTPTPTLTATPTPVPEVGALCEDCIDNDLDGDVDRDDSGCPQRADGMEAGLDPTTTGKAIVKCAKAMAKAGAKFASSKLKHLQKCVNAGFTCVQLKPGDPACPDKAAGTCGKEIGKIGADETKARAAIAKGCSPLSTNDLRVAAGLGFAAEETGCALHGVATLASVADIANCIVAEHECRVEDLVGSEMPRAAEMLELAGRNPAVEFPCLPDGSNGNGDDLGAAKSKAGAKCQKTFAKAGAKFASTKTKLVQKCAAAVYVCWQQKPIDPKCKPKAAAKCAKLIAKLSGASGAAGKLAAAIAKGCTKGLVLADVLDAAGLGYGAFAGDCARLGVSSLSSIADISTCLERRHECRVEQMLGTELPRLQELLDTAGVTLP